MSDNAGKRTRPLFHSLASMRGRDPHESGRVATTLELLYDLTLVVAFGVGGVQLAHSLATGHVFPGLAAFGFVQFATVWAWASYSWFASAFDTDDWGVRLNVGVQMVGILILTTGIPDLFHGFADDWQLENTTMVAGYIVMRISMAAMWMRAARANPEHAVRCYTEAAWTGIVQTAWIATCFVDFDIVSLFVTSTALFGLEFVVPVFLLRRFGTTPFHAHHVTERYGLLTIISLGEVVVGTSESARALHAEHGWWDGAAVVLVAGVSITLSLWWVYFSIPFGEILHRRRSKAYHFGYAHFVVFASIAAVGAGLHVAALREEGEATISLVSSLLCVVVPVGVYVLALYAIVAMINPIFGERRFHTILLALTFLALGVSLLMAASGVSFAACLSVAMLAPWVNVVGIETRGRRNLDRALEAD